MKQLKQGILLLLVSAMLCGCGLSAQPAGPDPEPTPVPAVTGIQSPEPTQASAPEPTPEPTPTPTPRSEIKRLERLEQQQDGFIWETGRLRAVDADGELIRDAWIGVLYFDEYGCYRSGSTELDGLVANVIRENTDESQTRMEKLKTVYEYARDNIKYVGFGNHDLSYTPAHGEDGWMPECAVYALENGVGNCYHFAAAFTALARGLGFQAYAASGVIGFDRQQHGWVEILDEHGNIWYCDPETEYSLNYWQQQYPDLFYKSKDEIGIPTGLDYQEYLNPFEAEEKEALERAQQGTDLSNGTKTVP